MLAKILWLENFLRDRSILEIANLGLPLSNSGRPSREGLRHSSKQLMIPMMVSRAISISKLSSSSSSRRLQPEIHTCSQVALEILDPSDPWHPPWQETWYDPFFQNNFSRDSNLRIDIYQLYKLFPRSVGFTIIITF